jgi:hypothetical protein
MSAKTDAAQNPTEWLRQRHLGIEFEIEDRAKSDGHFAIAYALLRLTEVLDDRLEPLADRLEPLADATWALAQAVEDLKPSNV